MQHNCVGNWYVLQKLALVATQHLDQPLLYIESTIGILHLHSKKTKLDKPCDFRGLNKNMI